MFSSIVGFSLNLVGDFFNSFAEHFLVSFLQACFGYKMLKIVILTLFLPILESSLELSCFLGQIVYLQLK